MFEKRDNLERASWQTWLIWLLMSNQNAANIRPIAARPYDVNTNLVMSGEGKVAGAPPVEVDDWVVEYVNVPV